MTQEVKKRITYISCAPAKAWKFLMYFQRVSIQNSVVFKEARFSYLENFSYATFYSETRLNK